MSNPNSSLSESPVGGGKEAIGRPLVELIHAWKECEDAPQLMDRLERAILHHEPMSFDASIRSGRQQEAIDTVLGIIVRGDELGKHDLGVLFKVAGHYCWSQNDARLLGFFDAVFRLVIKDSACFPAVAKFLLGLRPFKREPISLIEEARNSGLDLVQQTRQYLFRPNDMNQEVRAVMKLARVLINSQPVPASEDIMSLLQALKHCTEQENLDKDLRKFSASCIIYSLRCLDNAKVPDYETILLRLDAFKHLWIGNVLLEQFDEVMLMIQKLRGTSRDLQYSLLHSGLLEAIVKNMQSESRICYRVLQMLVISLNGESLDVIIGHPDLRLNLIVLSDGKASAHMNSMISDLLWHNGLRPRGVEDKWPILQLRLAQYLFLEQPSDDICESLLRFMRRTPMSLCIRELKEVPIRGLIELLVDPSGRPVRAMLSEPRFEEKAFDLAWLAFAVGYQFERDEDGRWKDMLAGAYPDSRSYSRIMVLHTIVWSLGVAVLERFRSLAASRFWLSPDLWRYAWEMLYDCDW